MDEQGVTYGDLLTLKLELPKTPDEIARPVDPGPNHGPNEGPKQFELTPLSRQFLQEWRLQHGCRFRVYEKRMGCRPKQSRSQEQMHRSELGKVERSGVEATPLQIQLGRLSCQAWITAR